MWASMPTILLYERDPRPGPSAPPRRRALDPAGRPRWNANAALAWAGAGRVAAHCAASVTATRYVTPLREGGSLPGLMEADDLGTYVVKWRAAGQGVTVLVAEVVCGELARALDLPVPALVTVDVAPELAVGEPDVEVQELLQRSAGRNLGLDYLPGALDFEAGADGVDPGSPAGCCGSTRSSATSTGRGATRTCCSGTAGCS